MELFSATLEQIGEVLLLTPCHSGALQRLDQLINNLNKAITTLSQSPGILCEIEKKLIADSILRENAVLLRDQFKH